MKKIVPFIFVFNTLFFNLLFKNQAWLIDLWYVSIYLCILILIKEYRLKNSIWMLAYLCALVRLLYNLLIALSIVKYNAEKDNFILFSIIILLFLLTENTKITKWLGFNT